MACIKPRCRHMLPLLIINKRRFDTVLNQSFSWPWLQITSYDSVLDIWIRCAWPSSNNYE
jgi:hypothetical protein